MIQKYARMIHGIGLIELGIGLRINNARRAVLARVSSLVNSERFSHYCSCPTFRDWIAVNPALFVSDSIFSCSIFEKTITKAIYKAT